MVRAKVLLPFICCLISTSVFADTEIRFATYNIKFLDADDLPSQDDREQKLEDVIDALAADVIALQEIDDRAALERIFPPNQWRLIIDDDSGENQDVALAVRAALELPNFANNLDADDDDFLFSDTTSNTFFPDRRDVLSVDVRVPEEDTTFTVMVIHAKSRFDGRTFSEPRRNGAAVALVQKIGAEFDGSRLVVLGDFNDTPDDRSLNILEAGNADAGPGPDREIGPFLINITEPLYNDGHVTFGRNTSNINNGVIDTVDPAARVRNLLGLANDDHTGDQMFDQILLTPEMALFYVDGSATVFDGEDAARGNNANRASDHLPVFADFVITGSGTAPTPGVLSISRLLPNPDPEPDDGNETITLFNPTNADVLLDGWRIVDRAANARSLTGQVAAAGEHTTITLAAPAVLNNSGGGDEVTLFNPADAPIANVSYTAAQAAPGMEIIF